MDLGETVQIDDQTYNGKKKVQTENKMFMDLNSIVECVKTLHIKNSEGYDRIPRRVLVDGIEVHLSGFSRESITKQQYLLSGKYQKLYQSTSKMQTIDSIML